MPGVFEDPLTASDDGVKLGESTFNFFLTLIMGYEQWFLCDTRLATAYLSV